MQQSPEILMEMCRKLVAMRKIVGDTLGYNFCANPICDMLFELYTAEREERSVYLWSLCMFAHVPLSTALRKVKAMERQGLIIRETAHRNRRRVRVRLTAEGNDAVEKLLDQLVGIDRTDSVGADPTSILVEFARREARHC